jgi:hypothetical protein
VTVINIAYTKGTGVAGATDDKFVRRAIPIMGPILYNAAGNARLVGNDDITAAEKVQIPAEALAANALVEITVVGAGGIYVTTGLTGDANIAAGGGRYLAGDGQSLSLEIGKTPAGVQHTHLLLIGV